MKIGQISFECSDEQLTAGFQWAKKQALSYTHDGDKVGKWYEAALPGRDAFCIRDVCHHISGAHYLGLAEYTKNMMCKFVASISESRDYCAYWEITKDDVPAPVDYKDDNDFWYNLPANFDLVDGCWRAYCLTGDADYLTKEEFVNFYQKTFNEYIGVWDSDNDGIPNRKEFNSRRGIPSYDEQKGMEKAVIATDLIAAQIRALISYAQMCKLTNQQADDYIKTADMLALQLQNEWWDRKNKRFFSAKLKNNKYISSLGSPHLLLYFDVINDIEKKNILLDDVHNSSLKSVIVELMSHYPEIYFKNSQNDRAMYWLHQLINPSLERREYPEVSFSVVGAYVEGLMGIEYDFKNDVVTCKPNLPDNIEWAKISNCPLGNAVYDIEYKNSNIYVTKKSRS